jgi:suppressor of ftsI
MISPFVATLRSLSAPMVMLGVFGGLLTQAQQTPPKAPGTPSSVPLQKPPEARSPLVLSAVNDPKTGKAAFSYAGRETPPVIRAFPGETMRITYENRMSSASRERCIDGPCMNMTNLHFHGLHVSPDAPQDDVITMMAMPGQSLRYAVEIPRDQAPGLYWYHTHPHGESYQQSLDGMSGAIVIEGIDRYVPAVRRMRERILILRDQVLVPDDPTSLELTRRVQMSKARCSLSTEKPERLFTVNGSVRPKIAMAPGERQFWRIVNASPDLYADLQVDGQKLLIVALDGMPLGYHRPDRPTEMATHILIPPAGRVEAIITGPKSNASVSLRSLCFDTGADGDPNPAMVLADIVKDAKPPAPVTPSPKDTQPPVHKVLSLRTAARLEKSPAQFVTTFTEDHKGFYINGKKYGPADGPMTTVTIGGYRHWRIVNDTHEVHPFHIHQVHFLFYAQDDKPVERKEWLDTVNVPPGGSVDLIMDFTDPIIRGMSLFHCHLLSHEDKGMMAKILFR